ncbi:MAG: glucose-6-phosphate isomerase [bacterium]
MQDDLRRAIAARLQAFQLDHTVERIWSRDHTVWKPDPTELSNRLGWLNVASELAAEVLQLEAFAAAARAEGLDQVLLLGMGGSSLGPEVIRETYGLGTGVVAFEVLDSTHPDQIRETEARLDLARTLVVVASKSGSTIETMSQFAYFWDKIQAGPQFVAITDSGSSLEALGRDHGFREVFLNRADIGGRFSVLSHFGMVPAALLGAPLTELLSQGMAMAARCGPDGPLKENPGVLLGVALGEAALAGRDKCTLRLPDEYSSLGCWVEQLVAESTGKEGRGILPVESEDEWPANEYGYDRIFVGYRPESGLEDAGQPVVTLDAAGLGGEFFRWEFATAVAGAILGVQPFDQPNVQEAKDVAGKILGGDAPTVSPASFKTVMDTVNAGDYIAINAFVPRNPANIRRLEAARNLLGRRYGVATTLGFGPRFLHSTGQLHKGGPNSGVFIEVVEPADRDLAIPEKPYTFGTLIEAQALGDLAALLGHGRRACRVTGVDELERLAADEDLQD